jgi:hypothetical protein
MFDGLTLPWTSRACGKQTAAFLSDQPTEVAAVDQLHVHIQPTVDLAVVVDRHHVWVGESCRRGYVAEELFEKLWILG